MSITKREQKNTLKKEIDRLLAQMADTDTTSDEYIKLTERLAALTEIKETNSKSGVSADTIANVIANLASVLIIVNHERANVITTKAMSFVTKNR